MTSAPPSPILRQIVLRTGYSDDEILRLRRRQSWVNIRPGGYLQAADAAGLDQLQRHVVLTRATVTALRRPAILSHVSAAVLRGIPLWDAPLGVVHITRADPARSGRSRYVHCHVADVDDDEIVVVDGLVMTGPTRTVLDLARCLDFERGVVAADGAIRLGLVSPDGLVDGARRLAGRPGARRALRVVAFADGRSESVGESRSRVAFHLAGLPVPSLQYDVVDGNGRLIGRSDFEWNRGRLLGEFDGRIKYGLLVPEGSSPSDALFAEKLREDALRDTGARVVRWTWNELGTWSLIDRVRRAIEATRPDPS